MTVTLERVSIRVKPGAARPRVGGTHGGVLVVAVKERAVDGRATEAALAALADAVGVRRRDVRLITGRTSRTKVVEVDGAESLATRLADLRSGASR